MRNSFTLLILFCLGAFLITCSEASEKKTGVAKSTSSHIDTSHTAILVFDQQGNWPFKNSFKPATLTDKEILIVDSLLRQCIADYNNSLSTDLKESYAIDFNRFNYKRQYMAAINESGQKEVWVNGFCHSSDDRWKKEIILVHDGGNCYFNLKVNLHTKSCHEVSVNGYA